MNELNRKSEIMKKVISIDALAASSRLMCFVFLFLSIASFFVNLVWFSYHTIGSIKLGSLIVHISLVASCFAVYKYRMKDIRDTFKSWNEVSATITHLALFSFARGIQRIEYQYEYDGMIYKSSKHVFDFYWETGRLKQGDTIKIIISTDSPGLSMIRDLCLYRKLK